MYPSIIESSLYQYDSRMLGRAQSRMLLSNQLFEYLSGRRSEPEGALVRPRKSTVF